MKMPREAGAALIVVGGFTALLLVVYVSGYFFMSRGLEPTYWSSLALRTYPAKWLAVIYRPAAMVEGAVRGHEIDTDYYMRPDY